MKISDKIKILFNLKKFSFEDLTTLKKYVDEEYLKRKKNLDKIRNSK